MTLAHLLPLVMFVTGSACLSPGPVSTFAPAGGVETREAAAMQLTGFVELYADEGVQLLTNGREITLIGETGLAVPLGGGEVRVTGHYVCDKVFRVESVAPVKPKVIASQLRR